MVIIKSPINIKEVLSLENEISLMSQLKHDRIVRYIGCQREENEVYIFMEYLPGVIWQ